MIVFGGFTVHQNFNEIPFASGLYGLIVFFAAPEIKTCDV
jgi:hypothetical protein